MKPWLRVFLTWKLWNALYYPPRKNPLFRRMMDRQRWRLPTAWLTGLVILGFGAGCALFFRFPELALALAFSLGIGAPISMIGAHGSILALWWAWHISDTLLDARREQQDDLLGMLPGGLLGAGWLISAGLMHRGDWLRQAHSFMRPVLLMVVGLLVILVLVSLAWLALAGRPITANGLTLIIGVYSLIALGLAFWFDHIQSILLAPLLGLLLPQVLRDRFLIRAVLLLGFPLLQIGTLLLAYTIYRLWVLLIFSLMQSILLGYALAMGLGLLTVFLMRETLLAFLWRAVLHVYGADPQEFFAAIAVHAAVVEHTPQNAQFPHPDAL
ncbi:MAG: hypothetical protein KC496_21655 [Anaerolineae bacterium]|nr:hypothetical protein [Anaerolineae bacterium]